MGDSCVCCFRGHCVFAAFVRNLQAVRHPETPSETTDSEQHRMTNCMMNQFAHTYTHTLTHYTQGCREMHGVYAARFIRSSLSILRSAPVHCLVNMFRLLTQHVSNLFFLMLSRFFSFFCVEVYGWTHSIFHHGPLGFQQR